MKKRMYAANFLFRKAISSFSTTKQAVEMNDHILLFDAPLQYLLINSTVSSRALHGYISKKLNRKYLSVCEQSEDEILSTRKYYSMIIEQKYLISIPTRLSSMEKYRNVHYLIDLNSPYTTLTHEALCVLHEKPYSLDIRFHPEEYSIGGHKMLVNLSNPNPKVTSLFYGDVNLLGRDYLRRFQKVVYEDDIVKRSAEITMIQN